MPEQLNRIKGMKLNRALLVAVILLALFGTRGIHAGNDPVPVVTDWSHHHMVFSPPRSWAQRFRLAGNIRYQQQVARQNLEQRSILPDPWRWSRAPERPDELQGLWEMNLGSGAKVGAGQFPAKYTFDPAATPNCGSAATPDYVVYNTSLAGSGTQATVVAFDNLYATTCGGTVPNTYWAYNTGSTDSVVTSVALSRDGTQVAFMQQVPSGAAQLVLLKWVASPATVTTDKATISNGSTTVNLTTGTITQAYVGMQISGAGIPPNDTIASFVTGTTFTLATAATANGTAENINISAETAALPGVPPTVTNANYHACTAPCMTTITLNDAYSADAASFHSDTYSAPFYDYATDVLYVGDDDGYLHRFYPVFNATPAETCANLSGTVPVCATTYANFPAHMATTPLSSPVFDQNTGRVFIFSTYCETTVTAPCQTDSGGSTSGGSGPKVHAICDLVAPPTCSSLGTATASGGLGPSTGGCSGGTTGNGVNMIVDAPIVNSTDDTLYVVVAQDGNGHSALIQFPTNYAANACGNNGTTFEEVTLGTGSTNGLRAFQGDFDNAFYSGSPGHMYVCGNAGGSPTLYQISIPASGTITNPTTATTGPVLTNTTTACSPVTEFYNSATAEYIFMSISATGTTAPGICTASSTGCIVSYNLHNITFNGSLAPTASANEPGGTSGIVVDNSSASTGASQVYFTPLSNETCITSTGTGGCATQASQASLN